MADLSRADLRGFIRDQLKGQLFGALFNKEGAAFAGYYYGEADSPYFPSDIDNYALEYFGSEQYYSDKFQDEAYLFIPFDENYYQAMAKVMEKRFANWQGQSFDCLLYTSTLSPDERTEYRTLFPEPVTWMGWWDDEDSSEVLEHGDFWVNAWQPEGSPKYTRQWLQQEFAAGRKRELCLFWGHHPVEDGQLTKSCLSQWWMEDFWSVANTYLCMEQYMMAGKAELFGDSEIREQILKCSDPKQIKALGLSLIHI